MKEAPTKIIFLLLFSLLIFLATSINSLQATTERSLENYITASKDVTLKVKEYGMIDVPAEIFWT